MRMRGKLARSSTGTKASVSRLLSGSLSVARVNRSFLPIRCRDQLIHTKNVSKSDSAEPRLPGLDVICAFRPTMGQRVSLSSGTIEASGSTKIALSSPKAFDSRRLDECPHSFSSYTHLRPVCRHATAHPPTAIKASSSAHRVHFHASLR